MKSREFEARLKIAAKAGNPAFSAAQLSGLMAGEAAWSIRDTVKRAVDFGLLNRVCRGIYAYPPLFETHPYKLEAIAVAMRSGFYSYVSLESALSEYSVISQIPLSRLTVMTTGRKGTFTTTHGTIEFTHTKLSVNRILADTIKQQGRPLRFALLQRAYDDLANVNRNMDLVNHALLKELLNDTTNDLT